MKRNKLTKIFKSTFILAWRILFCYLRFGASHFMRIQNYFAHIGRGWKH